MERLWTISELSERVAAALAVDYEAPENGQVRAVPSQRTIRYYTTIGLLSRPAEMRGRTALYDARHLAELVAIKRLQAQGLTLTAVQQRLAGAQAAEIAEIAAIPPTDDPAPVATPPTETTPFWLEAPASARRPAPPTKPSPRAPTSPPTPAATLTGYELAPGVTLLLENREHAPLDLTALRRAAAPLLAALGASPNRPT